MKQKVSYTLGIIVLVMMGLAISPAKAANPFDQILAAIAALQTSVNNQSTAIGTLQTSVDNLESFQGNMPPAWYQTLPSDQRFLLVMGNEAVLDRETGLVWEKEPGKYPSFWLNGQGHATWYDAFNHCHRLAIGGRLGWRLPMFHELVSLVDKTKQFPVLPEGHPFVNVHFNANVPELELYWSSYNDAYNIYNAWAVDLGLGEFWWYTKQGSHNVWCVRGGHGVNPVPNSGGPLP